MNSFDEKINGTTPVLVDFSAEWCGPCKMMGPILKQLKDSMGENITILKVDVDRNQVLSARYNIRNVPTLKLFKNGKELWSGAGVRQAQELKQLISQYI